MKVKIIVLTKNDGTVTSVIRDDSEEHLGLEGIITHTEVEFEIGDLYITTLDEEQKLRKMLGCGGGGDRDEDEDEINY
jgi:hypothetical protein